MAQFNYQKPFPIKKDTTAYRLLTKDFVSTVEFDGRKILKGFKYLNNLEALRRPSRVIFFFSTSDILTPLFLFMADKHPGKPSVQGEMLKHRNVLQTTKNKKGG